MPPERGNSAASSAYVSAPHSVTAPPSTQLRRNSGTSSTRCAIAAGVRKMPLPIVEPTTTATALHRPRRRGSRSPQRSSGVGVDMRPHNIHFGPHDATLRAARLGRRRLHLPPHHPRRHRPDHGVRDGLRRPRSEEHTSELQSPCNLVCRLLLEKKKNPHHHIDD